MTFAFLLTVLVVAELVLSVVIGGGVAFSRRAPGLALFLSVALPSVALGALLASWSVAYIFNGFNTYAWGLGFITGASVGVVAGQVLTAQIEESCRTSLLRRQPFQKRWPPPKGAA